MESLYEFPLYEQSTTELDNKGERIPLNDVVIQGIGNLHAFIEDRPGSGGFADDKNRAHIVNTVLGNLSCNGDALHQKGFGSLELELELSDGFADDIDVVLEFPETGQVFESTMTRNGQKMIPNWWFLMDGRSDGSPRDIMIDKELQNLENSRLSLIIARGGDN